MSKVRDEIGKIIDMRIPPGAYRRYIKEITRTGGFGQKQHEDCIIAFATVIEELENRITILEEKDKEEPAPIIQAEPIAASELKCDNCEFVAKSTLGLLSHARTHKKDDATI